MSEITGLTTAEAIKRLKHYGPNSIPEKNVHVFLTFLHKFWDPIPWMLEAVIVLEIFLGKLPEASIIFALLLFNVAISFFHEQKALRLLKSRLNILARVLRDNEWKLLPNQEIVPGDVIRLRVGDIIPADVRLLQGYISMNQAVLTGESLPIEGLGGTLGYAGATVVHGEAFAEVVATAVQTHYGKIAEIVQTAEAPSHLGKTIYKMIRYLVLFETLLIACVVVFSVSFQLPLSELIPFSLLLLVASVPVALSATYTLATALGSLELVKVGVLVTRLPAIEEAAAMTTLCVDKTGTLTQNSLEIAVVTPLDPYSEDELLTFAALACEESTQDPIDLAILKEAKHRILPNQRLDFIPFDPEKKFSESLILYFGQKKVVRKGAPSELVKMTAREDLYPLIEKLGTEGSRILGVGVGDDRRFEMVGFISFHDPLREDSKRAIAEIQELGIRVVMLTGDSMTTAQAVSTAAGIGHEIISKEQLYRTKTITASAIAGIFPEDKLHVIHLLQKQGLICGMTGDGVNDAPALKQAEVGIAVSNATDVAKASASLVLTKPGLTTILEAIKTSRKIYQRLLTYTLNKIIKTLEISILLAVGLILEGNFIISQLLIVLLLFTNDFVTISIATDHVHYSKTPQQWNIGKLMKMGGLFAIFLLGFSFTVFFLGKASLPLPQLQTLIFLTLVFTGQATVYLVREQRHCWQSMPSLWMVVSSVLDVVLISMLAISGTLMAPLPWGIVLTLFAGVIFYYFLLDFIKVKFLKVVL